MNTIKRARAWVTPLSIAVVASAALGACKSNSPAEHQGMASAQPPGAVAPAVVVSPVRVEVTSEGFQPSRVALGPGRQIVFRRTNESTCATVVVFPDLGIEKQLPLNADVVIELPPSAHGELGFQCGMGMYKSKVVVQ